MHSRTNFAGCLATALSFFNQPILASPCIPNLEGNNEID